MTERKIEHKTFKFEVTNLNAEGRTIEGYAAVFGNVDLGKDVIVPGAFTKTIAERGRRVKFLWQHIPSEPIGRVVELREDARGLFVKAVVSDTQRGRDAIVLLKDGAIDGLSIGYDVILAEPVLSGENVIRELKEVRLWEISLVTFPMNELATVTSVKKAPDNEEKTVSGASTLPIAERDTEWDADAAIERVREFTGSQEKPSAAYRNAFFWYDAENEEEFGAYKLPFADVIDGELTAVPRGVFAAAAAVQGARGGVAIPKPGPDMDAVKERIAEYYMRMRKKFNDDSIVVPWEAEEQTSKSAPIEVEHKAGRAISREREKRIRDRCEVAIEAIKDLLVMLDELNGEQLADATDAPPTELQLQEAGKAGSEPESITIERYQIALLENKLKEIGGYDERC